MDIAAKEARARSALQELGLEVANKWASEFETRPTQQLILQKLIDPVVRHVLNSMLPWIIGMSIFFLVLLVCTVVTTYMVIRSGGPTTLEMAAAAIAATVPSPLK
jgi:hypothetical protein